MGLFGFGNYNKPGPGVNKDDPVKAAPIRYFEIFGRKLSKLVQVNLLFLIPTVICAALMFLIYLYPTHYNLSFEQFSFNIDLWAMYVVPIPLIFLYVFVAGMTMITRNFVREEHAFVYHDFKKAVKNNFKLFLINGVVCYLVYVLMSFAIIYYFSVSATGSPLLYIPLGICLVMLLLFVFAQYYMPILMITFDLNYRQALKNCLILGLASAGRNLLMTVAFIVILGAIIIFSLIIPLVAIIAFFLLILILFAFISYTVSFVTYPVIKKYMIDLPKEREKKQNSDSENPESKDNSSFEEEDNEESIKDQYVYVNGRLIKKSEADRFDNQKNRDE